MAVDLFTSGVGIDTGSVGRTPGINTNVVASDNTSAKLVQILSDFSARINNKLDQKTQREATIAGANAGLAQGYQPTGDEDTIAGLAFNQAGNETYLNKSLVESTSQINELAQRPDMQANPAKLDAKLQEVGGQFIKSMPQQVMPNFLLEFKARSEKAVSSARVEAQTRVLQENRAAFMASENQFLVEASNAARDGNEAEVARLQKTYFDRLDAQAFVGLNPMEIVDRKLKFSKSMRQDAVVGEFMRTEPDKRPAFIESYLNNNPLKDILTAEEQLDLQQKMITTYNTEDTLQKTAKAELDNQNKLQLNLQAKQFYVDPTPDNLVKMLANPAATPEDYKSGLMYMENRITKGDPLIQNELDNKLYSGTLTYEDLRSPNVVTRMPQKVIADYHNKLTEFNQGAEFRTTPDYEEVLKRVREDFAAPAGIMGEIVSEKGKAIRQYVDNRMRTEYPLAVAKGVAPPSALDIYNEAMPRFKRMDATTGSTVGPSVQTKTHGEVIVPKAYFDDPASYTKSLKAGTLDPRLKTMEVQDFMVERQIQVEKEKKTSKEAPK